MPKSQVGRRWITLDTAGVRVLRKLTVGSNKEGLFRTRNGKPPTPGVVGRELKQICAEACVPVFTPHDLRHVQAMLAREATRDP